MHGKFMLNEKSINEQIDFLSEIRKHLKRATENMKIRTETCVSERCFKANSNDRCEYFSMKSWLILKFTPSLFIRIGSHRWFKNNRHVRKKLHGKNAVSPATMDISRKKACCSKKGKSHDRKSLLFSISSCSVFWQYKVQTDE